jgi:solute:Na+ symporter, SSS family
MVYDVSLTAANAVLYSVLFFFTLIAVVSGGVFNHRVPQRWISCFLLRQHQESSSSSNDDTIQNADYFLSARNSVNAREIALSFFASGMGAWVRLFGICTLVS